MAESSGTVCHVLPCSIEEDLTAPVAQYFQPTKLPDASLPSDARRDDLHLLGAQFRGRGLLCAVDPPSPANASTAAAGEDETEAASPKVALSKLPPAVTGVVLAQSTSSAAVAPAKGAKAPPARPLKMVERFHHVYNWSHEHDAQRVVRERHGSEKNGLSAALDWCSLAREVHDPIPVPP
ncbi:hypothetical protein ACHAXT_012486 [Thalassiosira profunda]